MKKFIKKHKVISLVAAIIIGVGIYYWYAAAHTAQGVTKYVIEVAKPGDISSTVSASGQVQATTNIDIKPQVTETVTGVYVQPGDHVTAGELLVQLDSSNEERAYKQAQLSLQSAQLQLEQMQTISTTTLLSDQSSLTQDEQSLANASTSLAADYGNDFDSLATIFIHMQTVVNDVGNFTTGSDINKNQDNPDAFASLMPESLRDEASSYAGAVAPAYNAALAAYHQTLNDYHAASRNSDHATLENLFNETEHTTVLVAESVKSINDLLNYVIDNYPTYGASLPSITNTYQTTFSSDINTANTDVTNAEGILTGLTDDKNTLTNSISSLNQASETLSELVAGPTQLDLAQQQVSIQSAENSLTTAKENLDDTSIRAPVDGIISAVPSTVGAEVPSPAVSMVGSGKIAEVTLNEIDAAKVQLGNTSTLTFDALPNLTLTGKIIEVDPVGTVSQGVVNYNVQIGFSEAKGMNQVKPGMSVTADITTAEDSNVIVVPSSAIISAGGKDYVLEPSAPIPTSTFEGSGGGSGASGSGSGGSGFNGSVFGGAIQLSVPPSRVPVTVGIANDTMTEITSGVNPGDEVIIRTVQDTGSGAGSAAGVSGAASAQAASGAARGGASFGGGGFGGGGGGLRKL